MQAEQSVERDPLPHWLAELAQQAAADRSCNSSLGAAFCLVNKEGRAPRFPGPNNSWRLFLLQS